MPEHKIETTNRLIHEKSPYLLQHAHNPVDWSPWGEEAFEKAKKEDKPVFLSIGYSTCHWCHVMAHESFEDREVAEIINEGFVSIKVDREERPDLDHLYMSVCQALTGSGGWPLTVFLTPDKKPFYAGTYFPKTSRFGHAGLVEVLTSIRGRWVTDRQSFDGAGNHILAELGPQLAATEAGDPQPGLLQNCYDKLNQAFDPVYGGFGQQPKFPTPHQLLFLLRYWRRAHEKKALAIVEKTLQSLYCGGIYDHIGFGFSRYSTDRQWLVPHFEKMLYDNALLAMTYLETYQATGKEFYARVAREIFTYVLRDMTSPEGGFYSAEDADSEGVEGKFYLWTTAQVKEVLGEEEGEYFCSFFDISEAGNFEGQNIPNLIRRQTAHHHEDQPAAGLPGAPDTPSQTPLETEGRLQADRQKLWMAREKRVHPAKDDKVLTAWNGLMIAALAKGAWVLDEPEYALAAKKAAHFIREHLRGSNSRLLARYRDGEAAYPGYMADYAFLTWGLLEVYQATFDLEYLTCAISLTSQMRELFWDDENGGFYFTAHDAQDVPVRSKELDDGAIPSGNSVAALNLLRLARLTGSVDYEKLAAAQLRAFAGTVSSYPPGYTFYLCALDFAQGPSLEVVLAAGKGSDTRALKQVLSRPFLPGVTMLERIEESNEADLADIAPFTENNVPVGGRATAYFCQGGNCRQPVTDPAQLKVLIEELLA